jgi:CHASE2 domain-containing sensor protein
LKSIGLAARIFSTEAQRHGGIGDEPPPTQGRCATLNWAPSRLYRGSRLVTWATRLMLKKALAALWARRYRVFVYVVLLAVGFALERTGDHAEEGGALSQTARATYQRVSTFGYRKPDVGYTALVLLDDNTSSGYDPPDVAHNGCRRRLYLAKLVHALEVQRAFGIVLDFRFEAICPEEDKALSDAISTAATDTKIIVVGQDSRVVRSIRAKQPASIGPGIVDSDLVPTPPQISRQPHGVKYGLIALVADNRRVPIRWAIATPGADPARLTERSVQDGVAFAAAIARKPSLVDDPKIIGYLNRGDWPLTSFIPEDKFPRQPGLDLLCKDDKDYKRGAKTWVECVPQQDLASNFNGRVVVMGFGDNDFGPDMHDAVLGRTSGVVLQANYIEAILDNRFLTQAWWPLQILMSFLCFAAIEIVFEFVPKIWGAVPLAILVVVSFYATSWVAMVQFGYYLDLWIPSALALILKVVSSLQSWAKEKVIEKNQGSPVVP